MLNQAYSARWRPLNVALAKWPATHRQIITNPEPLWRGLRIDYATGVLSLEERVIEMFSDVLSQGCVGVREVVEGSPAWKAGLRAGMLITQVEHRPVRTPAEFQQLVAAGQGTLRVLAWSSESSNAIYEVEAER